MLRDPKDRNTLTLIFVDTSVEVIIRWIFYVVSNSMTQQWSCIIIANHPDCITTSPSAFVDSVLDESVVWRNRSKTFVPLHTKVKLVSCDGNYSCEVKVLEVEKRFVVKFVSRLPLCFILHNSSIVYSEFTSFFISLHACSILILP